MKICVHNCGLPADECKCLLGSSDGNIEALQRSLGTKAEVTTSQEVGAIIDFTELERKMSEEQLRMWQMPTPELIRELESQGVDCDLLRMYPHEVKPLDLTRISSQCRNNDIAELYPKTFTIKNLGGNYQRLRPRYVYKGRTKRGPRRFRLQIVTRKEKACTI